jgi:hypothetical protein
VAVDRLQASSSRSVLRVPSVLAAATLGALLACAGEPPQVGTPERCHPGDTSSRQAAGRRTVFVYFTCGGEPGQRRPEHLIPGQMYFVTRQAPDTMPAWRAALGELIAGPTAAERARGFFSPFSAATAGSLASARRGPGGVLRVDFRELPAGFADSARLIGPQGPLALAELEWTLFLADTSVRALELRLGGSCTAFWRLLGRSCHARRTRRGWEEY